MNTQETKKPLYKQLNEQRTQGEWNEYGCAIDSKQFEICTMSTSAKDADGNQIKWAECEANAQYTALAVNELSNLAEALQLLKANFEANKKFGTLPNQQELETGLSIINTALSRIS